MADSTSHQNRLGIRLQEIADAVGIPVSWLHEGRVPPFANEAFDLLRLYAAITDGQGRQRVMILAQREAERCQASDETQS